ncbi:hypothetical protein [Hymenobacter metallilatus]|uniref:Uncharacterized protein n=1 Tax=Hymenobacter metallilatus TaxID=2493666 RepID=A0A428JCW9_9BACT|nr:hypothetical protein [Hymenobacter metallilatus]RSK29868.1 hypothetical protein EI290_16160 [Hymenobacter metallilatus]
MNAAAALASLGITPDHTGPFTYDELLQAAEAALALPVEPYSDEFIAREQLKGHAFLMAPAYTTPIQMEDEPATPWPLFINRSSSEGHPPF